MTWAADGRPTARIRPSPPFGIGALSEETPDLRLIRLDVGRCRQQIDPAPPKANTTTEATTTALDIRHQQMVAATMTALAEQGRTVIAVLHDLNLATRFNEAILLDQRSMTAHGPADTVLAAEQLSDVYGHPIAVVGHPLRPGNLILPRPGL